jgi:RNA polymerase sigma factor (sigma-70 family)
VVYSPTNPKFSEGSDDREVDPIPLHGGKASATSGVGDPRGEAKTANRQMMMNLFKEHNDSLFKHCMIISNNNESIAGDLVQEAFLTFVDKIDTIKDPGKLLAWLKSVVNNKYLDISKSFHNKMKQLDPNLQIVGKIVGADDDPQFLELRRAYFKYLVQNKPKDILIWTLIRHGNHSHDEVAKSFDYEVKTIHNLLSKMRDKIESHLTKLDLMIKRGKR